jgi:hypothetical protein
MHCLSVLKVYIRRDALLETIGWSVGPKCLSAANLDTLQLPVVKKKSDSIVVLNGKLTVKVEFMTLGVRLDSIR